MRGRLNLCEVQFAHVVYQTAPAAGDAHGLDPQLREWPAEVLTD